MEILRGDNVDKVLVKREEQRQSREQIVLSGLAEKSYQEVEDWVDEITNLPMAKQKLKVMAKLILAIIKVMEIE